jgi:hypothetical protein
VLPTADVLLAPREETLSDLLLNGGERIALAEFGTIQVPPEPMPVQAPPGPPSRGLCVRWPGRCAASRHTGMRHIDLQVRAMGQSAGLAPHIAHLHGIP